MPTQEVFPFSYEHQKLPCIYVLETVQLLKTGQLLKYLAFSFKIK